MQVKPFCGNIVAKAVIPLRVSLSHSLAERKTRGVGTSRGAVLEAGLVIWDEYLNVIRPDQAGNFMLLENS